MARDPLWPSGVRLGEGAETFQGSPVDGRSALVSFSVWVLRDKILGAPLNDLVG